MGLPSNIMKGRRAAGGTADGRRRVSVPSESTVLGSAREMAAMCPKRRGVVPGDVDMDGWATAWVRPVPRSRVVVVVVVVAVLVLVGVGRGVGGRGATSNARTMSTLPSDTKREMSEAGRKTSVTGTSVHSATSTRLGRTW